MKYRNGFPIRITRQLYLELASELQKEKSKNLVLLDACHQSFNLLDDWTSGKDPTVATVSELKELISFCVERTNGQTPLRYFELVQSVKEAVRILNYDGENPLTRLLEARACLLQLINEQHLHGLAAQSTTGAHT